MSKYTKLWEHVQHSEQKKLTLSFEQIRQTAGVEIDHSFLNSKKELADYGYRVGKISLKEKTVQFEKAE